MSETKIQLQRHLYARRIKMNFLLILGLWISNSIICCRALPRPQKLPANDFRQNFAALQGAPIITPLNEYVILEKNSNYTLRCEANEPMEWKLSNEFSNYEIKPFSTLDDERPYGSMLYLRDISYMEVGSYYCIKKSSLPVTKMLSEMDNEEFIELVNNNEASTIYIYVNDNEHRLAHVEMHLEYARQFEDVIIPCKPTTPDGVVLLTTPNGEQFFSDNTARYDPQRGFVVEIRSITDTGTYICQPKNPSPENEEEEEVLDLHFVGNEYVNQSAKTSTMIATITKNSIISNKKHSLDNVTNNVNVQVTNRISNLTNNRDYIALESDKTLNSIKPGVGALIGGGSNIENTTSSAILLNTSIDSENYDRNSNEHFNAMTNTPSYDLYYTTDDNLAYEDITNAENFENESIEIDSSEFGTATPTIDEISLTKNQIDVRRLLNRRALYTTVPSRRSSYSHSTPRSNTKFVNKPQIISDSAGHAFVGQTFRLTCEIVIAHDVRFIIEWSTPGELDPSRMETEKTTIHNNTATHNLGRSVLTVKNAQKSDAGNYKCTVTDHSKNKNHNKYLMTILNENESYVEIAEPTNYYSIYEKANKLIQMTVKYRGYPRPTMTWFRPDGTQIQPTHRFIINTTDSFMTLKIHNTTMMDSGEYTLRANNGFIEKELKFNVSISDETRVFMDDVYVQEGEEAHVTCRVLSVPTAVTSFLFTPCKITPHWPTCEKKLEQSFNSTRNARPGLTTFEWIHDLYFKPESPGIIHCLASNSISHAKGKAHILIGDITDNMTVYGVDENKKIARGDEVMITCAALAYYFSDDLYWYKDGVEVEEGPNIEIIRSTTDYSYKKTIKFKSIQDHDRGSYECRASNVREYDVTESKFINIFVHEPAAPKMLSTNLQNSKIERKLGDSLELECKSEAIPRADVNWFKDDEKLNANKDIAIEEGSTKLIIPYIKPEDEGVYKCVVSNRLGSLESNATIKISNMPGVNVAIIWGAICFFLVLIILVIYLFVRVKRERKQLRELKAAGLANFEEGALEHINPALTLDEQADLLPYDRNVEFPRAKLKLGKQLGAGAFGVVLKAFAEGIKPEEKETVVAVKMVKRTADNEVMRALVSELKIMIHLGQHLNVVNLLGAVTKNIAKRELMVIVEYCRYGNVQNFLLRNRKRFIDQINPQTNKIDPTIMTQRFSDNFELSRGGIQYVDIYCNGPQYINQINHKNNTMNNRRNSDNDPRSGTRAGRPNSKGYSRRTDSYEGPVNSCATEQTVITSAPEDEEHVLSNNSVQPAWRSNYKTDSTEAMTITTSDLVSWAFQVARGMDYLSSRKVLHGDLAARNILLCEDNIVKICDFGLARSMYKSDNYKKQGEARLPIKWLALESFSDQIFSTYTDVWSFGIVLWEFFSLAKVPYPGIDPNQNLFLKLKDGYRMEKPPFANDELYDIMLECWSTNPESRPLFNVLEKRFAKMLGDEVTNHYMDLNDPYMRANTEFQQRSQTDYLALMGSPDEIAPPPPRYVNGHILPEIRIESSSDDYLQMSTDSGTAIFSPTRPKDNHNMQSDNDSTAVSSFTFPDSAQQNSPTLSNNLDSPINKNRRKDIVQPEEMPMLHSTLGEESPEQPRKFANILKQTRTTPTPSPRHHVETKLNGNSKDDDDDDNYVNVISQKNQTNGSSGKRTADAFSNPTYQPLKTVSDNTKAEDK